jgi:zinc protease
MQGLPYPISTSILRVVAALFAAGAVPSVPAAVRTPLEVLRANNAALQRHVLDNGMVALLKEDHSAPVVAVEIWVGTGSIHEEEFLGGGLSHYLEHMVFKGTPTRGPADITRQIDGAGGDINAYTSFDRTVFHTTLPSRNWQVGVDVLGDAVLNASLPEAEWLREREVVLREVAMGKDDPNRVMSKLLFRTAYRVHPYRLPVIGHEDVLTQMTREELKTFHRRHYVPDNMAVVVAGAIDADEVLAYLRENLGSVPRRARAPVLIPAEPPQLAPRFARETGTYNVTRAEFAFHTVPLSHPDTPALDLLARLAGRGRSSRLVQELKEDRQLVHEIDAWSYTPKDPGLFAVSATFDPDREEEVLRAVREQIAGLAEVPFSEDELAKGRRQLLVSELAQLQTAKGQAQSFASGEFYAGDPRYAETYLEALNAVTPADLQRVAARYLGAHQETLVLLSPEPAVDQRREVSTAAATNPVTRQVLDNGVTLLVREDHRLPFVQFAAALRGGLLSETAANNGISQLAANMLTRGTPTRSAEELAATVEALGGSLTPFSGRNSFGISAGCLSGDEEIFLALMVDCLGRATIPEEELKKERALQLAAIQREQERPFYLANQILTGLLFPGHPYRWDALGTPETVASLDRAAVKDHLDALVGRANLVLAVFGDITVERARELAEQHLASLPEGKVPRFAHTAAAPDLPDEVSRRVPKEQTILLMGVPGVAVDDPRVDALNLLENALSGLSSDLMIDIRDKRGLVYFTGAFQRTGLDPGSFGFYAGTQEASLAEVQQLIRAEVQRITTDGLREEELERSRAQLIARHEKGLQENSELAQICALNELYGLGYDHIFSTSERLEALTVQDVRKAAASILRPDRMAVAVLLPEQQEEHKEDMP